MIKWLVIWVVFNVYPASPSFEPNKNIYGVEGGVVSVPAVYHCRTEEQTKYQVFDSSQSAYDFVYGMPMTQGIMLDAGVLSYEIYEAKLLLGGKRK